jgi:hypothetical protein
VRPGSGASLRQPFQDRFAIGKRQRAQVLALGRKHVERHIDRGAAAPHQVSEDRTPCRIWRDDLAIEDAASRQRREQPFESLHPVAAFRQHAAVDRVGDPAEAIEFQLKGPLGVVEGLAPNGRDNRNDAHPELIPALEPPVNRAVVSGLEFVLLLIGPA